MKSMQWTSARNWESANGTFKIDAALKNLVDGKVTLIKLDLDEIHRSVGEVELARYFLCQQAQKKE